MHPNYRDRLVVLGQRVQRAKTIIEASNAETMDILGKIQGVPSAAGMIGNLLGKTADPQALFNRPIVDAEAMTVTWRGNRCPLGYTRLLDLMERLARSPNRWIPYKRLLDEVWDGVFTDGAIKVAVTRLRTKLAKHRMTKLARMIRTCGYRCGYFPDGLPE